MTRHWHEPEPTQAIWILGAIGGESPLSDSESALPVTRDSGSGSGPPGGGGPGGGLRLAGPITTVTPPRPADRGQSGRGCRARFVFACAGREDK